MFTIILYIYNTLVGEIAEQFNLFCGENQIKHVNTYSHGRQNTNISNKHQSQSDCFHKDYKIYFYYKQLAYYCIYVEYNKCILNN